MIVVAERMLDETDAVVGASGYYIDLTKSLERSRRDLLDETLPRLVEARAVIEQAKGALRFVYGMNDEQAFKLLQWRSQENNTKLRALATQLVNELETVTSVTSALRSEFDHLIMTVHERAPGQSKRMMPFSRSPGSVGRHHVPQPPSGGSPCRSNRGTAPP